MRSSDSPMAPAVQSPRIGRKAVLAAALATLMLQACTSPVMEEGASAASASQETTAPPEAVDALVGTQRAFFDAFPSRLLVAAAEACNAPNQSLLRRGRTGIECETLPTPQAAAALILSFDGTVSDLPRFVIGFTSAPAQDGFIVTAENFIRVPARNGDQQQIRIKDENIESAIREVLTATGGTPLL